MDPDFQDFDNYRQEVLRPPLSDEMEDLQVTGFEDSSFGFGYNVGPSDEREHTDHFEPPPWLEQNQEQQTSFFEDPFPDPLILEPSSPPPPVQTRILPYPRVQQRRIGRTRTFHRPVPPLVPIDSEKPYTRRTTRKRKRRTMKAQPPSSLVIDLDTQDSSNSDDVVMGERTETLTKTTTTTTTTTTRTRGIDGSPLRKRRRLLLPKRPRVPYVYKKYIQTRLTSTLGLDKSRLLDDVNFSVKGPVKLKVSYLQAILMKNQDKWFLNKELRMIYEKHIRSGRLKKPKTPCSNTVGSMLNMLLKLKLILRKGDTRSFKFKHNPNPPHPPLNNKNRSKKGSYSVEPPNISRLPPRELFETLIPFPPLLDNGETTGQDDGEEENENQDDEPNVHTPDFLIERENNNINKAITESLIDQEQDNIKKFYKKKLKGDGK